MGDGQRGIKIRKGESMRKVSALYVVCGLIILGLLTARVSQIGAEGLATGAWPCRGHDARHTGQSPYTGVATNTLKWIYQMGDKIYDSPAIGADGTIYIGCWNTMVYAINFDGSLKWSYPTGGRIFSSPAVGADGTIYIGSADARVYAINPDGTPKWDYQTGGRIFSSPTIGADGTVYIGSDDMMIYAFTPNGGLKWSYQTGNTVSSSPAVGADGTIYVGSDDANIYAINTDGSLKWSYQAADKVWSSPAIGADGSVYVGSNDGQIYAFNYDGSLRWSYQTGDSVVSSPSIGADGVVYVGSNDGQVYAFNSNGSLKWSYQTGDKVYSSPAIGADGTVYIGSYDSRIYAFGKRPCTSNDQCLAGDFCQKEKGNCNGQGICSALPQTCTDSYAPVCGCDDITYPNACTAANHAANIDYSGECRRPESCDGKDNDGDGLVDEEGAEGCITYYKDADGDGFGTDSRCLCAPDTTGKYTARQANDCNDADARIHPGATEQCGDDIDTDCDGQTSNGCCNGDLNSDGAITPQDALTAFRCYLGTSPCSLCDDVNQDGQVTPSDALCLFRKFLGQSSCLD